MVYNVVMPLLTCHRCRDFPGLGTSTLLLLPSVLRAAETCFCAWYCLILRGRMTRFWSSDVFCRRHLNADTRSVSRYCRWVMVYTLLRLFIFFIMFPACDGRLFCCWFYLEAPGLKYRCRRGKRAGLQQAQALSSCMPLYGSVTQSYIQVRTSEVAMVHCCMLRAACG